MPMLDADAEWVSAAYAAHGPELYRFALRSLGDSGLAEEAVQSTYLRAWRNADRFDDDLGSLRTWLFAIISNAADWRGETLGRLRAIVLSAGPDIAEDVKWKKPSRPEGVPVWSANGIVCIGE